MKKILLPLLLTATALTALAQQPSRSNNDHLIVATLWFQRADEYRALCYQAYNLAQLRLDQELASHPNPSKKPAVVVDIDETVLDNSPFEARCIVNGTNYPTGWNEWVSEASATTIPGAVEFLNYAAKHGVEVFYISNRKQKELHPTLLNLQNQRFPMADTAHLLLRTSVSNKEDRRNRVLEKFNIVLLAGDNLNDFTSLFEATHTERRRELTDSLRHEFGRKFIVLPNPMYGDWEQALGTAPQPSDSLKRQAMIKALRLE